MSKHIVVTSQGSDALFKVVPPVRRSKDTPAVKAKASVPTPPSPHHLHGLDSLGAVITARTRRGRRRRVRQTVDESTQRLRTHRPGYPTPLGTVSAASVDGVKWSNRHGNVGQPGDDDIPPVYTGNRAV